jgi:HK97 family phage major capsid protein
MGKMTKVELYARNREIQSQLSELNDKAYREARAFSEEEQRTWDALSREKALNEGELRTMLTERELAKYENHKSKGEMLRELFKEVKESGKQREILLAPGTNSDTTQNTIGNITASGAIELSIHEIIPTLHEGLGLPETLRIVTGVTGNEVWPVSINDVEMEELGEVAQLADQNLDFANITPVQRRVGLKVPVSNMAIDNAAFDLLAFVQAKFTIALRKYLAKKVYSQAEWTGNKGPFSGLTPSGTITLGSGTEYADILQAVAQFSDKGFFEGDVTIVLDRVTEAQLKATPKIAGAAGGFVVENGLCAGYPYVVTHYLNTELDSNGKLVPTSGKCIGIGYFEWLALQQHGQVRMVVDPVTLADRNVTRIVLSSAYSITDLSVYINGGAPSGETYPTQAFALYSVAQQEPTTE